jgi:hypothetical protein
VPFTAMQRVPFHAFRNGGAPSMGVWGSRAAAS